MLLIVALVFTAVSVKAQFKIGAKAGYTMSQYQTDDLLKDDMGIKPGYTFGTMVDIKLAPFFHFQPEFTYYQKGATYKGTTLDLAGLKVDYLSKTTVNYLHIPLNLKFNIPVIPVYLIAGPYVSYGLSSTYYNKTGIFPEENTTLAFSYKDNSSDIRPFDFGLNFGTGYKKDLILDLVTVFVEARFDVGLLDNNNSESTFAKNRNVGINAGVLFGL